MKINPLTAIDFYKTDHRRQYPDNTQSVYSNFTPRSTRYMPSTSNDDNKVVFFGLQYFIKWFLIDTFNKEFFSKPKNEVVAKYKRRLDTSLGKDSVPVDHIEALHDLQYLPIVIKALPEGVAVNAKIPFFTIRETSPVFSWLTNYLETILSCSNWAPSTAASIARKYRKLFNQYCNETGGLDFFTQFQGHDFSFRGMSSYQTATMTGSGHLLFFTGTDTVPAIDFLEEYYGANAEQELIGCSVPATEHSVMTMSGPVSEFEMFKRLITEVYPNGIVSIVSDSFDYWQVVTNFLPRLKNEILSRSGGAPVDRVVIRPDSGDPVKIICGDPEAEIGSPQYKGTIECLWETFGGTINEKGYRQLDSHIGLIYGDSITLDRCEEILERLKIKKFTSTNVVLGIGSYTYQYNTRDSAGFAMKATAGAVNGKSVEIFKDPKTDTGMKKSAKGLLRVDLIDNEYVLKDQCTPEEELGGELREVFRDGKLLIEHKLSDIRERALKSI